MNEITCFFCNANKFNLQSVHWGYVVCYVSFVGCCESNIDTDTGAQHGVNKKMKKLNKIQKPCVSGFQSDGNIAERSFSVPIRFALFTPFFEAEHKDNTLVFNEKSLIFFIFKYNIIIKVAQIFVYLIPPIFSLFSMIKYVHVVTGFVIRSIKWELEFTVGLFRGVSSGSPSNDSRNVLQYMDACMCLVSLSG